MGETTGSASAGDNSEGQLIIWNAETDVGYAMTPKLCGERDIRYDIGVKNGRW